MIETVKTCRMCGKIISDLNDPNTDWYSHIKKTYCENCKPTAEKIRSANKQKSYRLRKQEEEKQKDELILKLLSENQRLREMVAEMRDHIK